MELSSHVDCYGLIHPTAGSVHSCHPTLVPTVHRHAQTTDSPVHATSAGLYFHTQNSDMLDHHVLRSHVLLVVSVPIPRSLNFFVSDSLLP
jgi:hypothetical protein